MQQQLYIVSINEKKRTAKCLVHYTKHTTTPAFIPELCKKLGVANTRRSAINYTQKLSTMTVPDNSYILFDVVVRTSPEVFSYYMQAGGCMGFIGNLKDECDSVCFDNINVWPLNNTMLKDDSLSASLELAQQHFNLTTKLVEPVSRMVSVAP